MIMLHDLRVTVCVCSEGSALFHITLLGELKDMGYNMKIGISSVLTLYLHWHVWTRMRELCIIEMTSVQTA